MRRFALLLVTLLLAACGDSPVAPENAPPGEAVRFNFLNGPDNPGEAGLFRFEGTPLLFSIYPAEDLFIAHFQADDSDVFCGGGTSFALAAIQIVANQETVERRLRALKDAPVFIYRWSDPEPDNCVFFTQNWLYKGTHSMVEVDNNLEAGLNNTGANAFGLTAAGTVYDPEGTRCSYNEHQKFIWYPDRNRFERKSRGARVSCQGNG